MKNNPILTMLLSVTGYLPDSLLYEATTTYSEQAKRDGVFLRRYRISPMTSYLPIEEAFIEQRRTTGAYPKRLRRRSSTILATNLVLVCGKPPKLGVLGRDWDLVLADGVSLDNQQEVIPCQEAEGKILKFELKERPLADSPIFLLRLRRWQNRPPHAVKTIDFMAAPL